MIYTRENFPIFVAPNGAWNIWRNDSGYCASIPHNANSGHLPTHFGTQEYAVKTLGDSFNVALDMRDNSGSPEWHFFRSYVGTALATTPNETNADGEFLDSNADIDDIAAETLESMLADCARFYIENKAHIHCEEREDYEAAARAVGWTRNAHNGYFVAPAGSETRMADYDDWEELCIENDIEPIVIPGAPLSREFEGSIAAREAAMAGHDFWLTRCGHGAGFWDGDWPEPAATALDKASEAFGNVDLYVGDDGKIYA